MINFLLFLSITLNLVAFLCIVLLYLRQNKLINMESEQAKNLEEMEDVITSFIQQIKEENDQFIEKLAEVNTNKQTKETIVTLDSEKKVDMDKEIEWKPKGIMTKKALLKNYTSTMTNTPAPTDEIEKEDIEELLNLILPAEKVESELEEVIEEEKEVIKEISLLDQALELQEEGKSIDEIAKSLNKGKTEIELLLKFRQN